MKRVGGIIEVKLDGEIVRFKGECTYSVNQRKRSPVIGSDGVHGYSDEPKVCFIEGKITDSLDFDTQRLFAMENVTVTASLANGKVISLPGGWYAGEGEGSTSEGEIDFRFESDLGEEIR